MTIILFDDLLKSIEPSEALSYYPSLFSRFENTESDKLKEEYDTNKLNIIQQNTQYYEVSQIRSWKILEFLEKLSNDTYNTHNVKARGDSNENSVIRSFRLKKNYVIDGFIPVDALFRQIHGSAGVPLLE